MAHFTSITQPSHKSSILYIASKRQRKFRSTENQLFFRKVDISAIHGDIEIFGDVKFVNVHSIHISYGVSDCGLLTVYNTTIGWWNSIYKLRGCMSSRKSCCCRRAPQLILDCFSWTSSSFSQNGVEAIRDKYREEFNSREMMTRQRAVAL